MAPDAPSFRQGEVVYHRANGQQGVVLAITYGSSDISYRISWGPNQWEDCDVLELSREKVIDGVDGGTTTEV